MPSTCVAGRFVRLGGNDDLAAMGGAGDACRPMHIEADVITVDDRSGAGVQAHANEHWVAMVPRVTEQ